MWLAKLILKLKWYVAKLIDIKPFLRVDANAYCPLCGHRQGSIHFRTDGNAVVVEHECAICKWKWLENPVTNISRDAISHVFSKDTEE